MVTTLVNQFRRSCPAIQATGLAKPSSLSGAGLGRALLGLEPAPGMFDGATWAEQGGKNSSWALRSSHQPGQGHYVVHPQITRHHGRGEYVFRQAVGPS